MMCSIGRLLSIFGTAEIDQELLNFIEPGLDFFLQIFNFNILGVQPVERRY